MHEEWFEKQAKKLNITESKQNKSYVEIVLPKDVSAKVDGELLFFSAYEICKQFRFSYIDGNNNIMFNNLIKSLNIINRNIL